MCILTSDGKALTDLGILGGETQHSNIHVCVSASLKGQQANSRWAKENGHSQAGNHSSGASVPTPAPAVAEGDLELAIATSAYCGGSLSLSPGQGYRTPHTSFMGRGGDSRVERTAEFCKKKCLGQWKPLHSFICMTNQLCFPLAPHAAKLILFIFHIAAFKFECGRGERGPFHLFSTFIKDAGMNMWHPRNTWQCKQGEPAVACAIGITNSHHPASSYHARAAQGSREVSSGCMCWRRISQRRCWCYLLKKEISLPFPVRSGGF